MSDLEKLKENVKDSPFLKTCYEVSTPIDFLKGHLLRYNASETERNKIKLTSEELQNISNKDFFEKIIPEFQRSNDKWTKQMKIKFVENILSGIGTSFLLGNIGNKGVHYNCMLIDGQQRVTALVEWMNGNFPVFNDIYYSKELDSFLANIYEVKTKIYTFENEKEMVKFYISMNENITHSKEDIKKAKDYLEKLESLEKKIDIKIDNLGR